MPPKHEGQSLDAFMLGAEYWLRQDNRLVLSTYLLSFPLSTTQTPPLPPPFGDGAIITGIVSPFVEKRKKTTTFQS